MHSEPVIDVTYSYGYYNNIRVVFELYNVIIIVLCNYVSIGLIKECVGTRVTGFIIFGRNLSTSEAHGGES